MSGQAYTLRMPENPDACVVFNSPHSGAEYPPDFLAMTRLDLRAIRSSEDAYVDQLFESAPQHGAPLLSARFPRAYVDLNRAANELDPALVRGVRLHGANPRIMAGLGVIPRVVAGQRAIRSGKMSLAEANRRMDLAYHPYHTCLAGLLEQQHARFGMAILVDVHSMPHEAVSHLAHGSDGLPDAILGNRFGASCASWVTDAAAAILEAHGFNVRCNVPFAGGHITHKYGQPSRDFHAIQVELDRGLYMNEATLEPRADFLQFQAKMALVTAQLSRLGNVSRRLAAE